MIKESKQYIYGIHVVIEALLHRSDIVTEIMYVGDSNPEINILAKQKKISERIITSDVIQYINENTVHQNVIAEIDTSRLVQDYKTYINNLNINKGTGLLLFSEVQDPHNIGAVLRSAVAFGMSGVLIPKHNQAPITAASIKVSAGMVFRISLVSIGNVNTILDDLKKRGFWVYGLEGKGNVSINDESFEEPSVIVLGNESRGIRKKTREHCDILLSIPMDKKCESLNASVSAGIAMHSWFLKQKR